MRMFWYTQEPNNWGDQFSQFLLKEWCHIQTEWSPPREAELFCTGSILENVPEKFTGAILGSGFMFDSSRFDLSQAKIYLLRGKLTAEHCQVTAPLADPGILAYLFARPTQKKYRYGIIPHYAEKDLVNSPGDDSRVIDIQAGIQEVIDAVSECEAIVSSTLHGLVLADSLGIPNAWMSLSNRVIGDGFKFADYYSVYDEKILSASSIAEALEKCETRDTTTAKLNAAIAVHEFWRSNWKTAMY